SCSVPWGAGIGPVCLHPPAITAFADLIISNGFQQVNPAEVGPEGFGYVNLGIGRLPEKKIAQPQLAAGADDQIEFRKMPRVKMAVNGLFINVEMIKPAVIGGRMKHGADSVHDL